MGGRVVFDVTGMSRWFGPPVGIVRVERELALWAQRNLPDVVFASFDPITRRYRALRPHFAGKLISGEASIDDYGLPDPAGRRRRRDRIPPALQPAALWLLQSRRMLLRALERRRLASDDPAVIRRVERLQAPLISDRYRAALVNRDGARRPYIPLDMAQGEPVAFSADDTLVCAGSGWAYTDIAAIARLKAEVGFRLVLMCYDVIPLRFPEWYSARDVAAFADYFKIAFATADLVVFNSQVVAADARAWCAASGLALGQTAITPLGASPSAAPSGPAPALPEGLEAGRYALFVSTLEPRKNHALLYRAWLRLLEAGVPQRTGFKLVFVGRAGWMVDDLLQALKTDARIAGSLIVLPPAGDALLNALYDGAAFCLYPSQYEGYGLPVVEAFFHGKAVIASTGGALPETVAGFSPCLDPHDEDAWVRTLGQWIEDPAARAPYEAAIRGFHHPTWDEAAERFFALVGPPP